MGKFKDRTKLFQVHPELKKVILLKQIPRYDPQEVDPMAIKQALSQLFNNTLVQLWVDSPLKNKILVGSHNIDCFGSIRESRYRHTKSGRFDGIHLYGNSGMKAYTNSVLNILQLADMVSEDSDHLAIPQSLFQNKRRENLNSQKQKNSHRNQNPRNQQLSTPTYNRFGVFSQNLGNE